MKVSFTDFPGEVEVVCGDTIKTFTVIPLTEIECWNDEECEGVCKFNKCEEIGLVVCNLFQNEENGGCVLDHWLLVKIILLIALIIGVLILLKKFF